MLAHSLLADSLFHASTSQGERVRLTLPEVLARLSAGEDLSFTHLRPHQRAPWHAFLVQLAYLACEHDASEVPTSAAEWLRLLRALDARDDEAAWCLVNDNWQQPAFLQPPCSQERVADFKRSAVSAQEVDVLVTARNHDEKIGKLPLDADALDVVVYALVTLQGWAAFLGAGNYNTMRMNGGFSSRPQFRLAFERGTGAEFCRDVCVLQETHADLAGAMNATGIGTGAKPHALLWLLPWDQEPLSLVDVHPFCLEVCRRVRLVQSANGLKLMRSGSNGMRVEAKEARGVVLDPWVPIVKDEPLKAVTMQPHSMQYRFLQSLLFDRTKHELPKLAQPSPSERRRRGTESGTLIAQVLITGDGRTDGWLHREIPMPPTVVSQYSDEGSGLGMRSQEFVELAGTVSGKVLRAALLQFVDGGDEVDWKNRDFERAVDSALAGFEASIDDAFFAQLFVTFEQGLDDSQAGRQWALWLAAHSRDCLNLAMQTLPTRDTSRLFAAARAERIFNYSLNKHLGALLVENAAAEDA